MLRLIPATFDYVQNNIILCEFFLFDAAAAAAVRCFKYGNRAEWISWVILVHVLFFVFMA